MSSLNDVLKELRLDDLQGSHRALAEKIGIDTMIALSDAVGGTQQYIPMLYELAKELIHRKVREEFDGYNYQKLALKYQISESTVRRTVQEQISAKRSEPPEGQLSLLDIDSTEKAVV